MYTYLILIIASVFLLITGCVEVDTDHRGTTKMEIAGVSASASEEGMSIPDDFPESIPVYPGSKVTATMGSQGMQMVAFESEDAASKVITYYEEQLKEKGWETNLNTKTADGAMFNVKNAEYPSVSIAISAKKKQASTAIVIHIYSLPGQ